jgi:bifunctional ADP-heptose synthase (sugar kinase/adenylyltransferase)
VTLSEEGSVIVRGDETVVIEATDDQGAGRHDRRRRSLCRRLPAWLHAGPDLADCGKLGSLAAGIVIQQIGPRPMISLSAAAKEAGLL